MSINAWGSDDPAEVAKGGTGNATLTDHGVLLGSGTAAVTPTAAATNGQLLIGSTGADPSIATPTGDSNEITLTLGAGSLAIGIADNAIMPGNAAMTVPVGTTAQEPVAADGKIRYDSDTEKLRASINGAWVNIPSGGAGALVYLATSTITSSTATVEFDNTYINTYNSFLVTYHVVPVSTSRLLVRISNDNGSTFHSTGYAGVGATVGGGLYRSTTDFIFTFNTNTVLTTAGRGAWGSFILNNMTSSSLMTGCNGSLTFNSASDLSLSGVGGGIYPVTEANDAIQILMSTGNIATAEVHLYGIAES